MPPKNSKILKHRKSIVAEKMKNNNINDDDGKSDISNTSHNTQKKLTNQIHNLPDDNSDVSGLEDADEDIFSQIIRLYEIDSVTEIIKSKADSDKARIIREYLKRSDKFQKCKTPSDFLENIFVLKILDEIANGQDDDLDGVKLFNLNAKIKAQLAKLGINENSIYDSKIFDKLLTIGFTIQDNVIGDCSNIDLSSALGDPKSLLENAFGSLLYIDDNVASPDIDIKNLSSSMLINGADDPAKVLKAAVIFTGNSTDGWPDEAADITEEDEKHLQELVDEVNKNIFEDRKGDLAKSNYITNLNPHEFQSEVLNNFGQLGSTGFDPKKFQDHLRHDLNDITIASRLKLIDLMAVNKAVLGRLLEIYSLDLDNNFTNPIHLYLFNFVKTMNGKEEDGNFTNSDMKDALTELLAKSDQDFMLSLNRLKDIDEPTALGRAEFLNESINNICNDIGKITVFGDDDVEKIAQNIKTFRAPFTENLLRNTKEKAKIIHENDHTIITQEDNQVIISNKEIPPATTNPILCFKVSEGGKVIEEFEDKITNIVGGALNDTLEDATDKSSKKDIHDDTNNIIKYVVKSYKKLRNDDENIESILDIAVNELVNNCSLGDDCNNLNINEQAMIWNSMIEGFLDKINENAKKEGMDFIQDKIYDEKGPEKSYQGALSILANYADIIDNQQKGRSVS